ncbi:MAG: CRISPR-associated endonuclease Cas1 [Candidatus Asgardarchaeia archaeon]
MPAVLMLSSVKIRFSRDKKNLIITTPRSETFEKSIDDVKAIVIMGASRFSNIFLDQALRRGLILIFANGSYSFLLNEHSLPLLSTLLEIEKQLANKRTEIAYRIVKAYFNNVHKSIMNLFKEEIKVPEIKPNTKPDKLYTIISDFEKNVYAPLVNNKLGMHNAFLAIKKIRKLFVYRTIAFLLINRIFPSYSVFSIENKLKIPLAFEVSLELFPIVCDELAVKLLRTGNGKLPPRHVSLDFMLKHLSTEIFNQKLGKHMTLEEIHQYQISLLRDTLTKTPVVYDPFEL